MVQLLKKLPESVLQDKVPRIILLLAEFLKSREYSTRKEAGATLVHVIKTLGSRYLYFALRELKSQLSRGYQRHVLTHTVHILIRELHAEKLLPPGLIDGECLALILTIYSDELFGELGKEKEVEAIVRKLPEAKKNHALNVIHRIGCLLGTSGLFQLASHLSDQCSHLRSSKHIKKMARILASLQRADSLLSNSALCTVDILTAAHMFCVKGSHKQDTSAHDTRSAANSSRRFLEKPEPDIMLLESEGNRDGQLPSARVSRSQGALHLLYDFGLRILYGVLRSSTRSFEEEHIEPFVSIVLDGLNSSHNQVLTSSIRCLNKLITRNLPSFDTASDGAARKVLSLFNEHSCLSMSKGADELQLILHKTVSNFIRHKSLGNEHLCTILDYIAVDLGSPHQSSHAFELLKAILTRKLSPLPVKKHEFDGSDNDHATLPGVIDVVKNLLVRSEIESVRSFCRDCLLLYLRDYELKPKVLKKTIDYFLVQLEYDSAYGRNSVVHMLSSLVQHISLKWIDSFSTIIFMKLLVQLDNEVDCEVKVRIHNCLALLISRCSQEKSKELMDWSLKLLNSTAETTLRLGFTAALVFIEADCERWFSQQLLDCLLAFLSTESADLVTKDNVDDEEVVENSRDFLVFQCCDLVLKVMTGLPNCIYFDQMAPMWSVLELLFQHRFAWVKRCVVQQFTLLLNPSAIDDISSLTYCKTGLADHLRRITFGCLDQLKSQYLTEEWSEEISKALIYLCLQLHRLTTIQQLTLPMKTPDTVDGAGVYLDVDWILYRLNKEAIYELNKLRPSQIRRKLAIRVCAGVCHFLAKDFVAYLPRAARVICRERHQPQSARNTDILEMTHGLCDQLRSAVGDSALATAIADVEKVRRQRKSAKESLLSAAAVNDPVAFAQRKRRRQKKKAEAATKSKRSKRQKLSKFAIST